jgi:hypothetical protein
MIDITEITDDMGVLDTAVFRAQNVLAVQLGSLSYAPDLGIDLNYFLSEDFQFQNESFRAYLLQRLAEQSVDVLSVTEAVNALFTKFTFEISGGENNTGLVR